MLEKLYQAIRQDAAPVVQEIDGRKYVDKRLIPANEPSPEPLRVSSLTGICDYIQCNVDNLDTSKLLFVVNDATNVEVLSNLQKPFQQRFSYIEANHKPVELPIGEWKNSLEFNTLIQATCADGYDKEILLRYIANIKSVGEYGLYDDGKAQQITVKKGISAVENDILPNPVTLAPYRTFLEIEQPTSKFILRVKENEGSFWFRLTVGDGGEWQNAAKLSILTYFKENLPNINIIA